MSVRIIKLLKIVLCFLIVGIMLLALIRFFISDETNLKLIRESPTDYEDFLKKVEQYNLREKITEYYNSLPDGDEKQNFKSLQDDVYDIINMITFNGLKDKNIYDKENILENIYEHSLYNFLMKLMK